MNWTDWLWISTQLSIITFCVVGICASVFFCVVGIQCMMLVRTIHRFTLKKTEEFDTFTERFSEGFAENFGKTVSIIAPLAGVFIGAVSSKKKHGILSSLFKSIFK